MITASFTQSLVEFGPVVLGKKIFKISWMYFFHFILISLWIRTWPFIRTSLNPQNPRMLCARLGWNRPSACGKENFSISSVYFCYFIIMFPLKRVWPFIWIKLNPFYLQMYWTKLGWNWPCGCEVDDENVKSLQMDRQTDDMRSEKLTMGHLRIPLSNIIGFYNLFKHAFWMKKWDSLTHSIQEKHDNSQTIT